MVLLSSLCQTANNSSLVVRIILAPLRTMVRVVLRTIHINVHFILTIKVELTLTVGIAPRVTIKTLNHTALCTSRIVLNFNRHHLGLCQNLQKGLHTIVRTRIICTSHNNAVGCHLKIIAFSRFGDVSLNRAHCSLAFLAHSDIYATFGNRKLILQQLYCISICSFGFRQGIFCVSRSKRLFAPSHRLRHRRNLHLLRPRCHMQRQCAKQHHTNLFQRNHSL